MHKNNHRLFPAGLLGFLLWLMTLSPLAFTSCDRPDADVDISLTSDLRGIAEAIRSGGLSLAEALSLIETAVADGFSDLDAAQQTLLQALESMTGTAEEKLAAVQQAVAGQTLSLETKLGLIEAAVAGGFADTAQQQSLIAAALSSLDGEAGKILAAIDTALQGQTTSLAMKLALIETVLKEGLGDKEGQELLQEALDALEGAAAERLAAIADAMESHAASLSAKLDLIAVAISKGLADQQAAQTLVKKAVESLTGTEEAKLAAVQQAVQNNQLSLETKLGLIGAAITSGFVDYDSQSDLIATALEDLGDSAETILSAIIDAITNQTTTLSAKLGFIETAVTKGFVADSLQQILIKDALDALNGTTAEKLGAIDTTMMLQTASLATKLDVIRQTYADSLANALQALGLIGTALEPLDADLASMVNTLISIRSSVDSQLSELLNDIFDAIKEAPDYSGILTAIESAIEGLDVPLFIVFEDFVTNDVLVIGDNTTLKVPYRLSSKNCKVTATGSDGNMVTVDPDPDDPMKGMLGVTASWIKHEPMKVEITISNLFKSNTQTLTLVEEQLTAAWGQDKNLNYDDSFDETHPLIFTYLTNTPGIVTIPDSVSNWVHLLYASSNADGQTQDTIKLTIDSNMGFKLRSAGFTVTNRVSSDILTFLIDQKYNSTIIDFKDSGLKSYLVADGKSPVVDINRDHEIEMAEAVYVTSLNTLFDTGSTTGRSYTSFNEFQYFTGITELPAGSFSKWTNLESITLPESITKLEIDTNKDAIFQECPKLRSIRGPFATPDSSALVYQQGNETILVAAVENRDNFTIPSGVTTIGHNVFYKNTTLKSVDLNQVSSIRDGAFRASGLTSVTIPAGVNTIGECAFVECASLGSFSGASSSGKYWVLPFDKNGDYDENGTGLCLMNDNAVIAYALASDRKSLNIPVSVNGKYIETISDYAFAGARYLEYLTLERRIKKMGEYSVYYCPNLKSVHFKKVNEIPAGGEKMFGGTTTCKIYVDDSQVDAFKNKDANWKALGNVGRIEAWGDRISFRDIDMKRYLVALIDTSGDGEISQTEAAAVTKFEDLSGGSMSSGANFKYFDEFQYFTGIKKLPAGSFNNWTELISITLPNSIETIDIDFKDEAGTAPLRAQTVFLNCPKLTSIHGGNDFTTDGTILRYKRQGESTYKLIKVVESLTDCTIPEGVDTIARYCFYGSHVKSVKLPASLKTIGQCAFEHSDIENVSFPLGGGKDPEVDTCRVTTVFERSFAHCYKLKKFEGATVNGRVKVCANGRILYWDNTVVAFAHGSSGNTLLIPDGLGITRLGDFVFDRVSINGSPLPEQQCILEKVALPEGIKEIGSHTFARQYHLNALYFHGVNPPEKCGVHAFDPGNQDITVYVPTIGSETTYEAVLGSSHKSYMTWSSWPPF
ncbi:MAG: leucine-rich repeat protein [Bacteroidales bacterium]|nr:leucine-rich repeat protein [Bacteroidales bacterium]